MNERINMKDEKFMKLVERLRNRDQMKKYLALRYISATLQRDPGKIANLERENYWEIVNLVRDLSGSSQPSVRVEARVVLELLKKFDPNVEDSAPKCGECGAEISYKFRFCPSCGSALGEERLVCPVCRAERDPSWRLCPFCGEEFR